MSNFENHLLSLGYVRHAYAGPAKGWQPCAATDRPFFSAMGDVNYQYRKPGAPSYWYGLNEADAPPGLCYPRPAVAGHPSPCRDAIMHRVLATYTPAEIMQAIASGTALRLPQPA